LRSFYIFIYIYIYIYIGDFIGFPFHDNYMTKWNCNETLLLMYLSSREKRRQIHETEETDSDLLCEWTHSQVTSWCCSLVCFLYTLLTNAASTTGDIT
jgi:hypothetical protein